MKTVLEEEWVLFLLFSWADRAYVYEMFKKNPRGGRLPRGVLLRLVGAEKGQCIAIMRPIFGGVTPFRISHMYW